MEFDGDVLLTYTIGNSVSMDSAVVTEATLTGSENAWPSIMYPFWFSKKYTFADNAYLSLLVREKTWSGREMLMVGVKYEGDYTLTTGLCYETGGEDPDPPVVCDELETCCDPFSQHHALFEVCLSDGSAGCCPEDGSNFHTICYDNT